MSIDSREQGKRAAGHAAAESVQDGMSVGLGTGSTAYFFIERLIQRVREEGLQIQVLPSSTSSLELARTGGLTLLDPLEVSHLDMTADGADELDPSLNMIKGAGGALLRERIVAGMSANLIILVDETKYRPHLGTKPIPLEVLPFGKQGILHPLAQMGCQGSWRLQQSGELFITDNGNHIFDLRPSGRISDPAALHHQLMNIPGVLTTGLFFGIAKRALIGYPDGRVVVVEPSCRPS